MYITYCLTDTWLLDIVINFPVGSRDRPDMLFGVVGSVLFKYKTYELGYVCGVDDVHMLYRRTSLFCSGFKDQCFRWNIRVKHKTHFVILCFGKMANKLVGWFNCQVYFKIICLLLHFKLTILNIKITFNTFKLR